MTLGVCFSAIKIASHWDHLLAPTNPSTGKIRDHSWIGMAKRAAGLALFIFSVQLLGFWRSLGIFLLGGIYHLYHAYQKAATQVAGLVEENPVVMEELDTLDNGIQSIIKAHQMGKKIGLVIGREKEQPLPKEDGWVWVSGNVIGQTTVTKDRIHLEMDFNHRDSCHKLQALFDKVVIDASTIKFIQNHPWERMKKMLRPCSTSQLITESYLFLSLHNAPKCLLVDVENGFISYPFSVANDENKKRSMIKEGEQDIAHYLETLFEQVTLKYNTTYPTREMPEITHFKQGDIFILTGPKS